MVKELDELVVHYRQLSYAPNTQKSYNTHLKCYMNFCDIYGLTPLPISPLNVCRYAAYLAGIKKLASSSVPKYLNIIRVLCNEFGFPNPMQECWFLEHVIRGIKKEHGHVVKKKLPITPEILLKIKLTLDMDSPINVAFWAACVVMFFGMLRKSNALVNGVHNPLKHLCRKDVYMHQWGLHMDLRWTKTIQDGSRVLQVPLPCMEGHPLCPTAAVVHAFKATKGAGSDSPAFCYIVGGEVIPLTYSVFVKMLKSILSKLGYAAALYAGHSFRRGGATLALTSSVPGEFIQLLGDWKSQVYREYLAVPLSVKAQQVQVMLSNIQY